MCKLSLQSNVIWAEENATRQMQDVCEVSVDRERKECRCWAMQSELNVSGSLIP